MSQHSPYFGRRTQQFSDWLAVKEREKARAENHMTRLRETTSCEHHQQQQQQQQQQQPLSHRAKSQNRSPSGKDNLKRLQQKIQQRRARARATLLYDLHQGVKSVEAQVQKQVEMVLSRLKEAPGSRYAFALTNTFLNTLPSALSQTILPSAISAVAATAATKATNMTALRDYGEHDDDDDDDDDDEDDEDEGAEEGEEDSEEKMWFLWQLQQQQLYQDFCYSRFAGQHQHYSSPPPQWLQQRLHQEQIQNQSAEHLSNELLRTVSIAPPSPSSSSSSSVSSSSPKSSSCSLASTEPSNTTVATSTEPPAGTVHISSKDASVLLSAGSSTTYASAASMVLSAAASAGLATIDSTLPSFLPTVVAPIVCVFSYPTPATSKVTSPQDASSPPPSLLSSSHGDEGPRKENLYESLARSSRSNGWTKAEREALFLAVTRFRLFGQWTKIKEMMNLHRTEEEIEYEYRRLYVDDDVEDSDQDSSDDEEGGQEQRQQRQGEAEDIQDSSQDGDDEDESDEDESNIDVTKVKKEQVESDGFSSSSSSASAPSSSSASSLSASASTLSGGRGSRIVDGVDLDQLSKKAQREFLRHRALLKRALKQQQQQQPVRWNEREVLVDKRFHLEEIPMHL
ncbi:hypothetical protein DFQ27_007046 [Actinomortierella ambigua]|uniref:Myb-like domain-containing protein n=1 Tax=Actinomortierella ambigua TaxID=1343610 RepID=A0A9P6UBQ8_9FUNG|nr:hypothetical protein DFQ27_007046 [Actinomortierella ambigua]